MALLSVEASWGNPKRGPKRFRIELGSGALLLLALVGVWG